MPYTRNEALAEHLDDDQLQAVQHRGSNLLIIAGAGSGKTRTLIHRAISFLNEVQPENMMVVTFTKKAANEISERILKHVPGRLQKSLKRAWIGTIHSICWRMLIENGHLVNLQPNWSVLDMDDSHRVMSMVAKPFGFTKQSEIKDLYLLYSFARNSMMDWRDLLQTQRFPNIPDKPDDIGRIFESYSRRCSRSNRVDFDDLQILATRLLDENPEICASYQERFKVIMVDEYQDTNPIQERLLRSLSCNENTITVVGDDAQSIYGFRAATVDNILNFEKSFSAERITIGTNYRSTPGIVALANASILNNRLQIYKQIVSSKPSGAKPILFRGKDPNEEAGFVLEKVKNQIHDGAKLSEMAVLFRATRLAASLEVELKQADIPYVVVGGEDFFSLEHIKLILDVARLLINPEDSIALAAIQELLGFGSADLLNTVENKADQQQLSFWKVVYSAFRKSDTHEKAAYKSFMKFRKQIAIIRKEIKDGESITPVISSIIKFLTPAMKQKYPGFWDEILADFGTLQTVASKFISLGDFVNSIALEQFVDVNDPDNDVLTLSTIHGAKGLEWNSVFVIGLVEFWFPFKFAIQQSGTDEEERRLFYVAVTRAKNELFLSCYKEAPNQYGKMMEQDLSRFVRDLPDTVYLSSGDTMPK